MPGKSGFTDRDLTVFSAVIVFLVAWIVYSNSLHNSLTFDDITFSPSNRPWELSLATIKEYFTSDAWAAAGKDSGLYRPLFLFSVVVETKVFGNWFVGYHLVNVLFHSLVALSLLGLTRYLLLATGGSPRVAHYAALLATLVYTVHPVHTEVVNSIFNRSSMVVTLGVLAGLLWFLPRVEKNPVRAWTGINLVFLAILFCRETAVVFPAILALSLLVTVQGDWRYRLRQVLPVFTMLAPMAVFFTMRSIALGADPVSAPAEQALVEVSTAPAGESLLNKMQLGFHPRKLVAAGQMTFDALKLLVWPNPLLAFHNYSNVNPWIAIGLQGAMLGLGVFAFLRKNPGPLLGLAIFYLALLPASRIFSGSGVYPHLAERYLYLADVGLAISLAFLLYWLLRKVSPKTVVIPVVAIALALTPLTWARNAEWVSNLKLIESDYAKGNHNRKTLRVLVTSLIFTKDYSRARTVCDRHSENFETNWYLSASCGLVYKSLNLKGQAENAYLSASKNERGRASAHYSLALLYLEENRRDEAEEQFQEAIKTEKMAYMKEVLAAEMLTSLYPTERSRLLQARKHLETAIELQPQVQFLRNRLAEVNRKLGKLPQGQD